MIGPPHAKALNRRCILTRSLILLALIAGNAQAYASQDWHTWGAIVASGKISEQSSTLRFWLEGQGRFNDDSSRFNQGIVRTALGKVVAPRTALWAGYAFIPNNPPGRGDTIVEHRAWQQLTWSTGSLLPGFTLATRTRLEQRTIEGTDDTGWRFRQLAKLTWPIAASEWLYLSLWDEIFLNFNDTDWGADGGLDQNRLFGGIGINLSANAKTEIGYLHQFVRRAGRSDQQNHILSLTVLLSY